MRSLLEDNMDVDGSVGRPRCLKSRYLLILPLFANRGEWNDIECALLVFWNKPRGLVTVTDGPVKSVERSVI